MNEQNFLELQNQGYTTVNVFDKKTAHQFRDRFTAWRGNRELDHIHGIIKSYGIGQADFMWDIRTHPNVVNVFQQIWNTKDLLVSFDGAGHYPADGKNRAPPTNWAHRDQASFRKGKSRGHQNNEGFFILKIFI